MDVIFLLGAGASKEADYPLMAELSERFPAWLRAEVSGRSHALESLFEAASTRLSSKQAPNIERVITLLDQVAAFKTGDLAAVVHAWTSPFDAPLEDLTELLRHLRKYIRDVLGRACDFEKSRYFAALLDFADESTPLDIFTMNYDQVLETTLARTGTRFTTGYGEVWEPSLFRDLKWPVRVFKLHGSVDWYRVLPAGPIFRGTPGHFAFPDAKVSDVLIYPSEGKPTHAEPYATLMEFFSRRLEEAEFLVAIGYSFGDVHIRRTVLDRLVTNAKLQVLICDPRADLIIENAQAMDEPSFRDFGHRVAGLWFGARDVLQNRQIKHRLNEVLTADNGVESVRNYVRQREFDWASTELLRTLGQCRRTDLWNKPLELLRGVEGGEYARAFQQALAGAAANALHQMKRNVPPNLTGHARDVPGSPLATLVMLWVTSCFKGYGEVSVVIRASISELVTDSLVGWSVLDGEEIRAWPIVPASKAEPAGVLEYLDTGALDLTTRPVRTGVPGLSVVDRQDLAILSKGIRELRDLWRTMAARTYSVQLKNNQRLFQLPDTADLRATAARLSPMLTPLAARWATPPQQISLQ